MVGVPNQHACGASPTSEKTRPWIFGACILCISSIFVTFSLVCPISVPAALRRPQKKHAPGILEHASCVFECLDAILTLFCRYFAAISPLFCRYLSLFAAIIIQYCYLPLFAAILSNLSSRGWQSNFQFQSVLKQLQIGTLVKIPTVFP